MKCLKCDKEMIQRDVEGGILATYPPQYHWQWWCGGCNHYEKGGIRMGRTEEDFYHEWKRKQASFL